MTEKQFIETLRPQGFCLASEEQENKLREINPHCLVLIRCGGGRALVQIQSLRWFVSLIKASDDYIRDVCIAASHLDKLGISLSLT
jgi:hypothetical protein